MILTKNTLFNISKHTNKTLKIADFLSKANQPLLFTKMAMVDENSTDIEFIEAFNSDLSDTTKKIEDVHQLLSTVDDSGNVIHLKGEQNLSKIFGESYDQKNQTITLPFGKIELKKELDRDNIKNQITRTFINLSEGEYAILFKGRNRLFKHGKSELYTDEDKIEFLSTVTDRMKYDDALSLIKKMSDEYTTFRKRLTVEERSLVDDKITFQRSMVDSITKGSTYITKIDGIVQVASGHKKQTEGLDNIIAELKINKFIDSVELDQDTDLNAFLNLMEQTREIKFNISEAVSLKSRKLGNYNANGLFFSSSNIVALDVKSPSAGVHEFVHAVDLKNDNIKYSQKRQKFASKMRSMLDLSGMTNKEKSYYGSTAEIIARAGEIAYILEEYNFKPENESIIDFSDRVSKLQEKSNPYDLNLVKNIKVYIEKPNIYFNLTKMPVEDLKMISDYYKSYFRISEELQIQDLKQVAIPDHVEHKVIGERTRYVPTSVGLINKDNIRNLLDYNEEHKIIEPEKLIYEIMSNPLRLNRTAKNMSNSDVNSKKFIIQEMCNWAVENDNLYMVSRIAEARILVDRNINIDPYFMAERIKNNPIEIKASFNDDAKEYLERAADLAKEYKEITGNYGYGRNEESVKRVEEIRTQYKDIVNETIGRGEFELDSYLNQNPLRNEIKETRRDVGAYLNANSDRLSDNGLNNLFSYVDVMMQEAYIKNGDKIFNYFNEKDLFPVVAMSQSNIINESRTMASNIRMHQIKTKNQSSQPYFESDAIIGLVNKFGYLKPVVDNINLIDIQLNKQLTKNLRGNINIFSSIMIAERNGFSGYVLNETVVNPYNVLLKGAFKVEPSELDYSVMKQVTSKELINYDAVQNKIVEHKNSFLPVEDVDEKKSLKNNDVESIIMKIDDNIKVDEKSLKSSKKDNPNQLKLF